MRTVVVILFIIFSAIVGWYFVAITMDKLGRFVLVIAAITLAGLIYLLFFDFILRVIDTEHKNPNKTPSELKEKIFVISLVLSLVFVNALDYYSSKKYNEIKDTVLKKGNSKRHGPSRGNTCVLSLELESGISQCVSPACWHSVEVGDKIIITPGYGLFGLQKLETPCKKE